MFILFGWKYNERETIFNTYDKSCGQPTIVLAVTPALLPVMEASEPSMKATELDINNK
jgi:hypothetical protein